MTGAILIGLGFSPLAASGLLLIANPAPVAYGALGTPIAGLASVTGLDPYVLGAMVGRQLPFFSLTVPVWLIWAFAGFRGMIEVWPAGLDNDQQGGARDAAGLRAPVRPDGLLSPPGAPAKIEPRGRCCEASFSVG